MRLPNPELDWPIDYEAVLEIARSEGCRLRAYLCSAGVPTIGWGHTEGVTLGMTISAATADQWFVDDLKAFTSKVARLCRVIPSEHQLGAMVSLAFNIGIEGFRTSTVLRKHNLGDTMSAARAFGLWNKVTKGKKKVVEPGLTARRAREAAYYLTQDECEQDDVLYSMPQRVVGESSLAASPIARGGALSTVTGIGALASTVLQPVQEWTDTLGVDPLMVVACIGIVVGVVVIWQRYKQRNEGWA